VYWTFCVVDLPIHVCWVPLSCTAVSSLVKQLHLLFRTLETMPTTKTKYSNAVMKRALAQQILEHEIKESASALRIQELEEQVDDLQAWRTSAKDFVDRASNDRKDFQKRVAIREANMAARERQLELGFKDLERLQDLKAANASLLEENKRIRSQMKQMKQMKDELLRQQKQRGAEIEVTENELRVVERLFVEHLEHMMVLDVTMHKQIGALDSSKNKGKTINDIAREMLRDDLKKACSECPPGTPGSGIDIVAKNLLEKLSGTYEKASKNSERLGKHKRNLESELRATTEKLMTAIKDRTSMEKKLQAEELNLRAMSKRVERLSDGEVGELRAMLTHSHKHYAELNGMLREFLKFSQEEMRKSLGFVPRTVSQVASICRTVPENPLADFPGYTPPGSKSPRKKKGTSPNGIIRQPTKSESRT
jgi:hypothetical protein